MSLYTYAGTVRRVVDADTVHVDIDLGFRVWLRDIDLRISRINAPENGTDAGDAATAFARSLLPVGGPVIVHTEHRISGEYAGQDEQGAYGRWLADLTLPDGRDYVQVMLDTGHAVLYKAEPPAALRAGNLVKAADSAYGGDLTQLGDDVKVVLGYIGETGYTPHVWTRDQVDAVRASGREWWAIIVPPEKTAMSAQTGHDAAKYALGALPGYAHPKSAPIFFDVEYSAWQASQQGCRDAVAAFKADMRAAGYWQAYGYTPAGMGIDWVAIWWGRTPADTPAELPSGCIGQQYLGDYGGWDYSVFDAALYTQDPQPSPVDPTDDDWFDMATRQDLIDTIKTPEVLTAISHKVREDIWNMENNRSANGSMHEFWSGGAPMVTAAVTAALKTLVPAATPDQVATAVVAALNAAGADKQVSGLADGIIDRLDDRGYGNTLKGARRGLDPNYEWTPEPAPSPTPEPEPTPDPGPTA